MGVSSEVLEKLKQPMPFKWREQSVNAQSGTMIAYIDARQLFDQLDTVVGAGNWQDDYKLVDGKLFGGIGIKVFDHVTGESEWVWKWDTGSESNVEKEKGEVSDAIKRAGIHWGVGRFLYSLGIVKLKSAEYNGKYKVADDNGKVIWDKDKMTELCNLAIKEGKLDRTKLKGTPSVTPKVEPKKTDDSAKKPVITKPEKPILSQGTEAFDSAKKAVESGTVTISQIEGKYVLSPTTKKLLTDLVPKAK